MFALGGFLGNATAQNDECHNALTGCLVSGAYYRGFGYRFIDAEWFQVLSYIGIITGETLTGILLAIAGILGLRRSSSCPRWGGAQKWTYAGGTLGLAVFFLGFMAIGGNWFIMYLNSKFNGLEPAFQNSVMTVFMLVLVSAVLVGSHLAHEKK